MAARVPSGPGITSPNLNPQGTLPPVIREEDVQPEQTGADPVPVAVQPKSSADQEVAQIKQELVECFEQLQEELSKVHTHRELKGDEKQNLEETIELIEKIGQQVQAIIDKKALSEIDEIIKLNTQFIAPKEKQYLATSVHHKGIAAGIDRLLGHFKVTASPPPKPKTEEKEESDAERFFSGIEELIKKGAFEAATTRLFGAITKASDKAYSLKLYHYIQLLFPHFTAIHFRDLTLNHLNYLLSQTPHLPQQQFELALFLGESYPKFADPTFPDAYWKEMHHAMHVYANAIKIAKRHLPARLKEAHQKAAKLFIEGMKGGIIGQLLQAKSQQNKEAFEQGISQIGELAKLCCVGDLSAYDGLIKPLYDKALDILKDVRPDARFEDNRLFVPCKERVVDLLSRKFVPGDTSPTERYGHALDAYRAFFKSKDLGVATSPRDVREFQRKGEKPFLDLMDPLIKDAFVMMGGQPAFGYNLLATGSTPKGERGQFSDVEFMGLYQEGISADKANETFKLFMQLLEMGIISLGETDSPLNFTFTCIPQLKSPGFSVDPTGNLKTPQVVRLMGTPAAMAKVHGGNPGERDALQMKKTILTGLSLVSTDAGLYPAYLDQVKVTLTEEKRRAFALSLLRIRLKDYKDAWKAPFPSKLTQINPKQFHSSLNAALREIAFYYGIKGSDPLNIAVALGLMDIPSEYKGLSELLMDALQKSYKLLPPGTNPKLSEADQKQLEACCQEISRIVQRLLNCTIDLKGDFSSLLNYPIGDLAIFFGLSVTNTLDIIDALTNPPPGASYPQIFTPKSGALLKEAVSVVYALKYRAQNEPVSVAAEERDGIKKLEKCYWRVLRPFYLLLEKGIEKGDFSVFLADFQSYLFRKDFLAQVEKGTPPFRPDAQVSFLTHFVEHMLEIKASDDVITPFFADLSKVKQDVEQARQTFLNLFERHGRAELVSKLEMIPTRSGLRLFVQRRHDRLLANMREMIQAEPHSIAGLPQVKVTGYFDGTSRNTFYLKPDYINQLLVLKKEDDPDYKTYLGELKKSYKEAFHRVAPAKIVKAGKEVASVHGKQGCYSPLTEFAIHHLTARISGEMTPSSELFRFHVEGDIGGNKVNKKYRVLFTDTIDGEPITEDTKPNKASWTKSLLCALVTRPGDGESRNHKVKRGDIFCVDNDISFVEPVDKRKINFTSCLFYLYPPETTLDPKVLKEFGDLEINFVLNDWMEDDVLEQEERYLALFTEAERATLWEKEEFSPSILLRKGALSTLHTQLWYLQLEIGKRASPPAALDLLDYLISISEDFNGKNVVGGHIYTAYKSALTAVSPPREKNELTCDWRLRIAVDRPLVSLKSRQALEASKLSKIPDLYVIDHTKQWPYQPIRALRELRVITTMHDGMVYERAGQTGSSFTADFAPCLVDAETQVWDDERLKLSFEGLRLRLNLDDKKKVTSLTVKNCPLLTGKELEGQFLNPNLEDISFEQCPELKDIDIYNILKKLCPKLKHLHLQGIPRLTSIGDGITGYSNPIVVPNLESFSILDCGTVTSVKMIAPLLSKFTMRKTGLKELELRVQDRLPVDVKDPAPGTLPTKRLIDEDLVLIKNSQVTVLDLTEAEITDKGFSATVPNIPLQKLDLSNPRGLTVAALTSVGLMTSLRDLNLSCWYRLRDDDLTPLSTLTNLTSLDLSRCKLITEDAVPSLQKLKSLKFLDVSECERFDEKAQGALKKGLPNLDIVQL